MSRKKSTDMMPRSRKLLGLMEDNWSKFRKTVNKRWSKFQEGKAKLIPTKKTTGLVLGSGYFGIVMSTSDERLVFKITSDEDEGYLSELILKDPDLRCNKGLPYLFDVFRIPEWQAYVILRENVQYGLDILPDSSPLTRSIPILDQYGDRFLKIESDVVKMLNALDDIHEELTPQDFDFALKESLGAIRIEIIKTLKRLPKTSTKSKYYYAMSVIRYILDRYGIALWDLHELNLGRHKYDMQELDENAPPLDKKAVLILDVGGNFGSPILEKLIPKESIK